MKNEIIAYITLTDDIKNKLSEKPYHTMDELFNIIDPNNSEYCFGEREEVESDPDKLQIISVAAIVPDRFLDAYDTIFTVMKSSERSSAPMKDKFLTYVGGHVSLNDYNSELEYISERQRLSLYNYREMIEIGISNALCRELKEETTLYVFHLGDENEQIVIYDSSNPSSSKHLCICTILPVSHEVEKDLFINPGELSYGLFHTIASLEEMSLDSWSKVIVDYIKNKEGKNRYGIG